VTEPELPTLPDLSEISVEDLMKSEDVALAAAVKRVVEDVDSDNGALSAFGSFVGENL
jgi:hypothetical protein